MEVYDMNHRKTKADGQKTAEGEKYLANGANVVCPQKAGYRAWQIISRFPGILWEWWGMTLIDKSGWETMT